MPAARPPAPRLNRRISVQGVTLRFEAGCAEPLDHRRRFGVSARVWVVNEERPLGRGSGNQAKILGRQADTVHQLHRVAAVACCAP